MSGGGGERELTFRVREHWIELGNNKPFAKSRIRKSKTVNENNHNFGISKNGQYSPLIVFRRNIVEEMRHGRLFIFLIFGTRKEEGEMKI